MEPDAGAPERLDAIKRLLAGERERAERGDTDAASVLFMAAFEGPFQLHQLAEKNPSALARVARRSALFPLNVHPSWIKDKKTLELFKTLHLGEDPTQPLSHKRATASRRRIRKEKGAGR